MRLECTKCVVRDWTQSDRESLLRCANNRNVWRNLLEKCGFVREGVSRASGCKEGRIIDRVIYAFVDRGCDRS